MKKILLTIFVFACMAKAGDLGHFDLIGFSKDGKYLAFRQFAVGDGTGFPYANVDIVDVARNTLVNNINVSTQSQNSSTAQVRVTVLTKAGSLLKKYGVAESNQGRFVAGALGGLQGTVQDNTLEFRAVGREYRLELSMNDGGLETDCDGHAPQLLKINLVGQTTKTIQNDTKLPTSRKCAAEYRMHSVFVYGSSLVVFVSVSSDGFEGPNIGFMAVTTKL